MSNNVQKLLKSFPFYATVHKVATMALDNEEYDTLQEALEFTSETLESLVLGDISIEDIMEDQYMVEAYTEMLGGLYIPHREAVQTSWSLLNDHSLVFPRTEVEVLELISKGGFKVQSNNFPLGVWYLDKDEETDYRTVLEADMLPEVPFETTCFLNRHQVLGTDNIRRIIDELGAYAKTYDPERERWVLVRQLEV